MKGHYSSSSTQRSSDLDILSFTVLKILKSEFDFSKNNIHKYNCSVLFNLLCEVFNMCTKNYYLLKLKASIGIFLMYHRNCLLSNLSYRC